MKSNDEIEYLNYGLTKNRTLKYLTWSFSGSKKVVHRCGDIVFWDSTHNLTKYYYKFSTFTVIESENKSRSVFFNLGLSEDFEQCQRILVEWHRAMDCTLPNVIVTDGDDAMTAAISEIPYEENILHMLCTFHLFDMNVKKKVQPFLQSNGMDSWPKFRSALEICREAGSPEELEVLWNQLISEWIDNKKERVKMYYCI